MSEETKEPTVEDYIREINGLEPKKAPEPVKAEEQEAAATSNDGEDAEAEEEETATDEGEASEEQEASDSDEESEDEEEEKPKRRRSRPDPKKRIRKLVAERNTERDENARLRAQIDVLMQQAQQPKVADQTPAQPQDDDPQPNQDDYVGDYGKYLEDRSAWASRQAVKKAWSDLQKEAQKAHQKQTANAREAEVVTQARALADKGREEFEDFEEVAGDPHLPVTEAMTAAMLASEIGHQVQYHLGSNPEEAARISQLNPVQQVREMALLEASLSTPKAKPRKKTTSAPEPIKPVGGKSAPRSIDEDTMPLDEYMTKFNRRELPSQKPR